MIRKFKTTVRKAIIKRIKHNKRKSILLVGVKNHVIALKNSRADLKKLKTEVPCSPAIPILGIYQDWNQYLEGISVLPFSLQVIHNSHKTESTYMSFDGWRDKMWYTHSLEYYSA